MGRSKGRLVFTNINNHTPGALLRMIPTSLPPYKWKWKYFKLEKIWANRQQTQLSIIIKYQEEGE